MQSAPLHPQENKRISVLNSYEILDSEAEIVFDDLTQLASAICGTQISLISLVDENRQWFKSKVGIDAEQTDRSVAFCSHAILGKDVFEVPNALNDSRFSDNPLVEGFPSIRFYAGAPLITDEGVPLGTLCVIDQEPKKLTADQEKALEILSRQVVGQLDLRLNARKKERAAKEQEKMFAALAHDLRSPFNSILGFSKLLTKKADALQIDKVIEMSHSILGSSLRVYELLDELLQWSQQRMGGVNLKIKTEHVKPLIESTQELLNEALNLKNIQLISRISADLQVSADSTITKTVFRNLITNAIKYSKPGQSIYVDGKIKGEFLQLSIKDEGEGIPKDVKDKLFKNRINSADGTDNEVGHGMGLKLCADFIRAQGGDIWVDDEVKSGACITFSLPLDKSQQIH